MANHQVLHIESENHADYYWWTLLKGFTKKISGHYSLGHILNSTVRGTTPSGFAGIDDPMMSQLDVTVFPNPIVDNTFTIRFSRYIADEFTVQIIDLTGNTIYTTEIAGSIENEVSVDLSKTDGIRNDIYTLCIICKEGSVFRKIVLL